MHGLLWRRPTSGLVWWNLWHGCNHHQRPGYQQKLGNTVTWLKFFMSKALRFDVKNWKKSICHLQQKSLEEPTAEFRGWLDFLVAHQDWRGLAAWVRSLPLKTMDLVDEEGKSGVDLEKFEQRGLRFCTSYAREVLLQQLGRRGIFSSGDTATLEALLCRLTLCGKLFGEGHVRKTADGSQDVTLASKLPGDSHVLGVDGEGGVLPLDQLLPMGRVSPFHCFFINFCINNETWRTFLLKAR